MTKSTVLKPEHEKLNASFTDFNGWDMPLKYTKELDEHRAVREAAGQFDLSHMGEIWVEGSDAATALNTALAGNFTPMSVGRAKYTLCLTAEGTIVDDLIVYRFGEDRYMMVPNAGNVEVVFDAMLQRTADFDVTVTNKTDETSLIAVQGPKAVEVLAGLEDKALSKAAEGLKNYTVAEVTYDGIDIIIARTGYTGEDGFEIVMANENAVKVWQQLLPVVESVGGRACGLAARDSLRLEAGMPLYGNELSTERTPFMAKLGPVVSFKKDEDFVGRKVLEPLKGQTPEVVLVAMTSEQRRAGRAGSKLVKNGQEIGEITSGIPSPTLGYPIALGYVRSEFAEPGTELEVDVRGKLLPFTIINPPFYSRKKS